MKFQLLAIGFLLSITNINAQENPKPSLLYKITGNGITQPSYIFGTFHMMCKEDFSISTVFSEAIHSTKQLFEEIKMDDPTIMLKSMSLLKSDSSLKTLLGEEKYKILDEKYKAITGMGIGLYNNFKPMIITSTITMKMIDCDATVQPETEIAKVAKEKNIEVFGLETIEEQMEAFNKTPLNKQIDDAFNMIVNMDSTKRVMKNLVETYKKREPELLYKFMKDAGASGEFEDNMLTKRNKNWIPIIEKNIKQTPTFFAVGAGHLGGEFGVLNLLLKQGYKLEPVYY